MLPENIVYWDEMDVGISPNAVRKPKLLAFENVDIVYSDQLPRDDRYVLLAGPRTG